MINYEIKAEKVNLVNEETKGISLVSFEEAIKKAEERELDLVNLTPGLEVPTVKICDYSKLMYEKKKKEKEAKKKQKATTQNIKEIQLGCDIAKHDLAIKAKNVDRIIDDGDKVNIVVKFKGRMIRSINNGPSIIEELLSNLVHSYKVDKEIKIEANKVSMCISPCKK